MALTALERVEYAAPKAQPLDEIKLRPTNRPSFELARQFDSGASWRWALPHFLGLVERADRPAEKINHMMSVAQMLMNLGRLNQADSYLKKTASTFVDTVRPGTETMVALKVMIKQGWVADLRCDFAGSVALMTEARRIIESSTNWREFFIDEHSTTTHFLGRGYLGLGKVDAAMSWFDAERRRLQALKQQLEQTGGNAKEFYPNIGFQYLWLARSQMYIGDLGQADHELEEARDFFRSLAEARPTSTIMASYHQLKGEVALVRYRGLGAGEGNLGEVRQELLTAFKIANQNNPEPTAGAEAAWELAKALQHEGENELSNSWSVYALTTYPQVKNRTFLA